MVKVTTVILLLSLICCVFATTETRHTNFTLTPTSRLNYASPSGTESSSEDSLLTDDFGPVYEDSATILDIKFDQNFSDFDPRNNQSLFQFLLTYPPLSLYSDNALFVRGFDGVVEMRSEPFCHYLPQSFGAAAQLQYTESTIMQKSPIEIKNGEILSVDVWYTCKTYNVEQNKFPAGSIVDAENDPRLATCGFHLVDFSTTAIDFSISATNKGIWLKYRRGARLRTALNVSYDAFEIYRFAGERSSVQHVVKGRIEIDRHLNLTRYYVDGRLLWTVGNWGVLSNSLFDGKTRLVGLSSGTSGASRNPITPGKFSVVINNVKKLDDADPNGPPPRVPNNSPTEFSIDDASQYSPGLVRFTNVSGIYDPRMTFVDEVSLRFSSLWGQGCKMGLFRLLAQIHTRVSAAAERNDERGGYKESGQPDPYDQLDSISNLQPRKNSNLTD